MDTNATKPGRRRWGRWKRMGVIALLTVAAVYAAWCVLLFCVQAKLLFPGAMLRREIGMTTPNGVVVLWHEFEPGKKTEAWFIPAPGASAEHPAPVVVYCHGNAELIDYQEEAASRLSAMGWSVLLPEYRGYGRGVGSPSQAAIREDCSALLDQVLARPDVDRNHVVFYGRSLGGGVAADLVTTHRPAGLILISTFMSVRAMAKGYWAPGILVTNPYQTDNVVAAYDGPSLICHGDVDSIVPVENGRSLAKLAQHGKYVEFHCDHNDFPGNQMSQVERFWSEVRMFLDSVKDGK